MEEVSENQSQIDLLQAALDHVIQGFSVFDRELRLVAWNRGLWEMLDFPQSLAQRGTHLEAFLRVNAERGEYGPGDIEGKIQRRLIRAREFKSHYFERIRPNGQVIAVHGTPLPQGGFVTTYSDVTEERIRQKRLEATVQERTRALRQSEEWLRLVTDNIPALIAYVAPGPVFRFANRKYAEWFQQSVTSIVGKNVSEILGEPLFKEIGSHIEHALAGHVVSYEYERDMPDGTVAYMRSTLIPDMTLDGRTLGTFVLSLDATEQKKNEATLIQSQRMDAVGKLTGGLAHDFNNILTVLMGNILGLMRAEGSLEPEQLKARLTPMMQASQRGAELTQRLLAFGRGRLCDPKPVRLAVLVSNVETLLRSSLPASITLSINIENEGLLARIDPTQLETALINMAFNSRDAMPDGGELSIKLSGHLLSRQQAEELNLPVREYACLCVRDTGTGMDEATRLQIFEPFFTTKSFGAGSGLGLSMVYGFVEQSGGAVHVSSKIGWGTKISLYIPALENTDVVDDQNASDVLEQVDSQGSGELILLVEDNADVAEILTEQIRDLGYTVLMAESADDGYELAVNLVEVKGVLTDIVMPGQMNGLNLAREIRKKRPGIGIALMTGYADWGSLSEEVRMIEFPVLHKPMAPGNLARVLRKMMIS